jgi:hypothetical protein
MGVRGGELTLFVNLYVTRHKRIVAMNRASLRADTDSKGALQNQEGRAYREVYHAAARRHRANIPTHARWRLDLLGCTQ